MNLEDAQTVEVPAEERWRQKALDNAPAYLRSLNPDISDDELAVRVEGIKAVIGNLADSESLKVIAYSGSDGKEHRSLEPDWSESNGFGLPVEGFAGLVGLEEPHLYAHADPASEQYLGSLADATQKPVGAIVDGKYVEPVAPHAHEAA